ncbi:MAG: hypothetical protein GX461_00520 [Clostridiales bacterium]|jgi:hypothetical protein|nr:hypothetical protein [Clostridiales bacterium]
MDEILNKILYLTQANLKHANQILKVTQDMKDHIRDESVSSLNEAIALRQKHIKDVQATEDAIASNMDQLKARFMIDSLEEIDIGRYPKVAQILETRENIKALYKDIYRIDEENRKGAEILIRNYKDGLRDIYNSKKVTDIYKKQDEGKSILLNKLK